MKWSVAKGFRPDDPTQSLSQALPKNPNKQKHRKSIHYDQVTYCIKSIHQSNAMLSTKMALEFLILTATRSSEVRLATWDEVNFHSAIWTIPAQRMKSKEEHIIPLTDRSMEILQYMKEIGLSNQLIFQGSKSNRPMSDMTMSKLVKELGFEADVHGFRTSFRVWVQEKTTTPFDVVEKALAHKTKNRVVAAYARSDLFDKRRELMTNWAKYLSDDTAKIIPLVMTK
jgi:integrase